MRSRFGSRGISLATAALTLTAATAAAKSAPRLVTKPADARTERQRWNDQVEARKAAKKKGKNRG